MCTFPLVEKFLFKMFQTRSSCGRSSMTVLAMRLRAEFILITLMKWNY